MLYIGGSAFPLGRRTYVMGIINVTPDSFSDGGCFDDPGAAAAHAARLEAEGAHLLDIGAESTRPGSAPLDAATELARLIPSLRAVRAAVKLPISVDTYKASVAEAALAEGADMINDISGLKADPPLARVAAEHGVPLVLMHRRPFDDPYPGYVWEDVLAGLAESVAAAEAAGIPRDRLVVDPGFGFGKTTAQNLQLVTGAENLASLGCATMVGPSRKSSIGRILDLPPSERVEGTLALAVLAAARKVDFVRVHDVKETVRALKVADAAVRTEAARTSPLPGAGRRGDGSGGGDGHGARGDGRGGNSHDGHGRGTRDGGDGGGAASGGE